MEMKIIIDRYIPVLYPNFSEQFIINTDSKKPDLGGNQPKQEAH